MGLTSLRVYFLVFFPKAGWKTNCSRKAVVTFAKKCYLIIGYVWSVENSPGICPGISSPEGEGSAFRWGHPLPPLLPFCLAQPWLLPNPQVSLLQGHRELSVGNCGLRICPKSLLSPLSHWVVSALSSLFCQCDNCVTTSCVKVRPCLPRADPKGKGCAEVSSNVFNLKV